MSPELIEFSNVVLRFVHVVAAIMWIGNSLLFTWMEINFIKDPDKNRKDALGHMNMLHAGGVYFLEKQKLNPDAIPPRLHVFKWQSYTTWLSGFVLLALTFYTRPGTLLLDPSKTDMAGWQASLISAVSLVVAWLVYDAVFRSPLRKRPPVAIGVLVAAFFGYALWIDQFYNGRFVYLQLGAMAATTMTANVFFVIIPNQKKIMKALQEGKPHDLEIGRQAKLRSLTNHYVTFPVIFLMLSAHFPSLYGDEYYLLLMAVIVTCLVIIKWMMNVYNNFSQWQFVAIATFVFGCFAVFQIKTFPAPRPDGEQLTSMPVVSTLAAEGEELFQVKGCNACHQPVDSSIAPTLHGLFGKERRLTNGETVVADRAYLAESILNARTKVVEGYPPSMPGYESVFTEDEVRKLVAYIHSLR